MSMWVVSLVVSTMSWSGEVLPVPAEAPISVEHSARLYRIEVYNTFRLDREEFNRRREMGELVWAAFEQAGLADTQPDVARDWFVAARNASLPDATAALPPLPEFARDFTPIVRHKPANEAIVPVATSAPEDRYSFDAPPTDVVTTLDIQLPPGAEQVGPTRFFSTLVKQVFDTVQGPDVDDALDLAIESPVNQGATDRGLMDAPAIRPAPAAPPSPPATGPAPTPKAQTSRATPPTPILTDPLDDPFDVNNLFEPATTPAETTERATDVDPFAP